MSRSSFRSLLAVAASALIVLIAVAQPSAKGSVILTDTNLDVFLNYYGVCLDFSFKYTQTGDTAPYLYVLTSDATSANTDSLYAAMAYFFAYLADDAAITNSTDFSTIAGAGYDEYSFYVEQSQAYYEASPLNTTGSTSSITLEESTGGFDTGADTFLNQLFGYVNGSQTFWQNTSLGTNTLNYNIATILGLYDIPNYSITSSVDPGPGVSESFDDTLAETDGQFLNIVTGNDAFVNYGITTYFIETDSIGTSYYVYGTLQYGAWERDQALGDALLNDAYSNIYTGLAYSYAYSAAVSANFYSQPPNNFQTGIGLYEFYANNALYYYALGYYYGYLSDNGVPPDTTQAIQYIAQSPDLQ